MAALVPIPHSLILIQRSVLFRFEEEDFLVLRVVLHLQGLVVRYPVAIFQEVGTQELVY